MTALIPAVILGLMAGLLRTAFFPALPAPFSAIDLPLILIVWYVAANRQPQAYVAAVTAGVIADALSALPPGTHPVAYVLGAWVAAALYTRVFTNHGWPALLGILAASFGTAHAVLAAARMLQASFGGWPLGAAAGIPTIGVMAASLGMQFAAAFAMFAVVAVFRRAFSSVFITR